MYKKGNATLCDTARKEKEVGGGGRGDYSDNSTVEFFQSYNSNFHLGILNI